ncbi:hypothetical protein V8E36_000166 [Tilletia maclaganii]
MSCCLGSQEQGTAGRRWTTATTGATSSSTASMSHIVKIEEDGFEILELASDLRPAVKAESGRATGIVQARHDAAPAAAAPPPVVKPESAAAESRQGRAGPAHHLRHPALFIGSLLLESGGESRRHSSAQGHQAREGRPHLLTFLARAQRGGESIWQDFSVDLAAEQVGVAWTIVQPAGAAQAEAEAPAALRALLEQVGTAALVAEWTAQITEQTESRQSQIRLVIRVSIPAGADNQRKNVDHGANSGSARASALSDRKHLLHALRTDETAIKKENFSMTSFLQAQPRWLLQRSEQDSRLTMRDLYNSLPPPPAEPWRFFDARRQPAIRSLLQDDGLQGIRTKLYNYQRRTIAQLLRCELNNDNLQDPLLFEVSLPDSGSCFVHALEYTMHRSRPTIPDVSGSILCEHMGLGKTLECISLILMTRGERNSDPPPGQIIEEPKLEQDEEDEVDELDEGTFWCRLKSIDGERSSHYNFRKAVVDLPPVRIHRSHATLVCVPMELLYQWIEQLEEHLSVLPEFEKEGREDPERYIDGHADEGHADNLQRLNLVLGRHRARSEDEEEEEDEMDDDHAPAAANRRRRDQGPPLRVLILFGNTGEMPAAAELAQYDIILLTSRRLSAEHRRCACLRRRSYYTSKDEGPRSPLMQVMFRRLIIDEGHILSSTNGQNNLVSMARTIYAQSRLVVSGTPTINLSGSVHEEIGKSLPPAGEAHHIWTASEKMDLERVGRILENFFCHPYFASKTFQHKGDVEAACDWKRHIIAPLNAGTKAPDVGAVERLRLVFGRFFVRSGDEARTEANLPQCMDRIVTLTMNAAERATFNSIQALINLNEISASQSLFSAANIKHGLEVVENVKAATFWFTSPLTLHWMRLSLNEPEELHQPTVSQLAQQREALDWLRKTLAEMERFGWPGQSLRYFTAAVDASIDPWMSECPRNDQLPLNMNAAKVISVRSTMREVIQGTGQRQSEAMILRRIRQSHELGLENEDVRLEDERELSLLEHDFDDVLEDEGLTETAGILAEQSSGRVMPQPKSQERKSRKTLEHSTDNTRITPELNVPSAIGKTKLMATSSTKLSWMLDYIRNLPRGEKVAIFSAMPNTRVNLADMLDVAQIKYAIHAPEVRPDEHGRALAAFRSKPDVRVLIMDFNSGGRGHNIQVASHCLLLEPVWNLDQELQAIKRFHRLGQTKPVQVLTLVMKDTFEEKVIARRREVKREQADGSITNYISNVSTSLGNKRNDFMADATLQQYISKARYVTPADGHTRMEPFTRLEKPAFPFAHISSATGLPMFEDDDDRDGQGDANDIEFREIRRPPPKPLRAGPASLMRARGVNLAAAAVANGSSGGSAVAGPSGSRPAPPVQQAPAPVTTSTARPSSSSTATASGTRPVPPTVGRASATVTHAATASSAPAPPNPVNVNAANRTACSTSVKREAAQVASFLSAQPVAGPSSKRARFS